MCELYTYFLGCQASGAMLLAPYVLKPGMKRGGEWLPIKSNLKVGGRSPRGQWLFIAGVNSDDVRAEEFAGY